MEGLRFMSWIVILKDIFFLMLWDPMGGWVFFDVLRQLLLERMLGLEMLNPKP